MDRQQTPEQIIASAMHLTAQQRMVIADALLESVPGDQVSDKLNTHLQSRIESAERGDFSAKTFTQIKNEARLEN